MWLPVCNWPVFGGSRLREIIRDMIESALVVCHSEGILKGQGYGKWAVEVPRRPEHGDYATNVAMVLSSLAGMAPHELAKELSAHLNDERNYFERIVTSPPGFINFYLNRQVLLETLRDIIRLQEKFGHGSLGAGEPVQVEFVSANPTGPLHIGHGRGAAVGDALANILDAAGYNVYREYYVNDAGRQMEVLGRSVYLRYLGALGQKVDFPEDYYRGDYIYRLAQEIKERDGARWASSPEAEALPRFIEIARENILVWIRADLERFGVQFDRWFRESSLYGEGLVDGVLEELRQKNLVYDMDGAQWFRSSSFSDDKDRVVVRSDGKTTYLASDIAYHSDKFRRGFMKIIDIWGADHHGYVPRMKAVVRALGRDPEDLHILLVHMVNLLRNGVPVPMSTRAGEFTTLSDVIDEVGIDAARYIFLMRSSDSPLDFDLEVAKRQERENPVYYVQYAHARICSIIREAHSRQIPLPGPEEGQVSLLALKEEWDLVKRLVLYPDVIQTSARRMEPHHLTYYLDALAAEFHVYYNRGWLEAGARVICDDAELTTARLLLVLALQVVLGNGLRLLGVRAPEKM
jgi:arginyl-tRNA synthetase